MWGGEVSRTSPHRIIKHSRKIPTAPRQPCGADRAKTSPRSPAQPWTCRLLLLLLLFLSSAPNFMGSPRRFEEPLSHPPLPRARLSAPLPPSVPPPSRSPAGPGPAGRCQHRAAPALTARRAQPEPGPGPGPSRSRSRRAPSRCPAPSRRGGSRRPCGRCCSPRARRRRERAGGERGGAGGPEGEGWGGAARGLPAA